MGQKLPLSIKYDLYESAVQCHESDIEFISQEYEKVYGKKPLTLREDFCGTAAMACDWVKQSDKHQAYGIDLDREPIKYGKERHFNRLSKAEKKRMEYVEGNVLDKYKFSADCIVAFNFSYFIFKQREDLVKYFKRARKGLKDKGAFFLDIFGGTECFSRLEESTEHEKFTYYWDCDHYNPITSEVLYYIHFKLKEDGVKYRKVFTYDWRHWTIAEVRDALMEAGFKDTTVFWEGDDEHGGGNGIYAPSEKEDNCESWVCYIMATN